MKKEIKYRDYRICEDVYTVKLTYMHNGGINGGSAVYVEIMTWHLPPRNFWQRISEFWKYNLNTGTWDPMLTEASLDAYIVDKCNFETVRRIKVQRGDKDWESI